MQVCNLGISVPPVQYIKKIVRVGSCLVVVCSFSQSTGSSSQGVWGSIPGDYWCKHNTGIPSPTLEGSGVKHWVLNPDVRAGCMYVLGVAKAV